MKIKKGDVIKEIEEENLLSDYISAGWKKIEENKEKKKESKFMDRK